MMLWSRPADHGGKRATPHHVTRNVYHAETTHLTGVIINKYRKHIGKEAIWCDMVPQKGITNHGHFRRTPAHR